MKRTHSSSDSYSGSATGGGGFRGARTCTRSNKKAVWAGRIAFLLCLVLVAAILGVLTERVLTGAETSLAESQFESTCERVLKEAYEITIRKRMGTIAMASVVAEMQPNADDWPFITIPGYETMAMNIINASSGQALGLAPLVRPDQIEEFETFIYDFFENKRRPPFVNDTAVRSSFGKGIWGVNPTLNTTDLRYRITNASTTYGSRYDVITPISFHQAGYNAVLLFNSHSEETRGLAIDSIIDCSAERAKSNDPESIPCGVLTDILILIGNNTVKIGPGAVLMQPVYPADNKTVLSGIIMSTIVWDEVLHNVFPATVSGIDCVLETEHQVYTYRVTKGIVSILGKGDLHDPNYDKFKRSINLTGLQYYNNASAIYSLSLYPTDTLYAVFSTANPTTAAVGSVLIIIFTSLLFFLYDFFVRKEFTTKDELLDSKRRFVRFISHEVRTPLNAVCMGLSLVQDDLALALGFKSNDDLVERTENDRHVIEHIEPKNEGPLSGNVGLQQRGTPCELLELQKKVSTWVTLVEDIRSNAQSSVDVLNDLLNYDKVETGSLSLELTVVSVWNLIETTANEFLLPAAKKKISFELIFGDVVDAIDEETPSMSSSLALNLPVEVRKRKIVGDAVRLTQVLRNLVSNALKFTQSGGKLTVHASWIQGHDLKEIERTFVLKNSEEVAVKPSGSLQVKVQDSGAGMTKEQLSQLFQHGVQFNVNDLQAGQGSGLGLYIAKGIVEQHEGRLWAESGGIGCGTTFTISLPMYNIEGMDVSSNFCPDKTDDYSTKSEPACLHILVVDDAISNRKLLSRLLINRGHTVEMAEDGSVALAMINQAISEGNPYDTILLDYEMPVMNGPTAAKEIRAMGCDVFIIGVTGNMLADDIAFFRSCGANALLGKPFKIASLEEIWSEYGVTSCTPSLP